MEVSVKEWSAWTPGWSFPACESDAPDVSWVPANTRRRLSKFTRMAFFVAHSIRDADRREIVFASRHGDLPKTVIQLQNLVAGEPLSPMQFALSVHNAANGQFSIVADNQCASTTVSAGEQTLSCALLAAIARLHSAPVPGEVVVVFVDDMLPEPYRSSFSEPDQPRALAILLGTDEGKAAARLRLESLEADAPQSDSVADNLLAFFHQEKLELSYACSGYRWDWQRR